MKKYIFFIITTLMSLYCISCNKQITTYKFLGFDKSNHTAYIAVPNETEKQVWLNTAYYVLDSMNIVLNKENKDLKLDQLALISYGLNDDNQTIDSNVVGSFKYIFDTKEQTIIFKGNEIK